MPVETDLTAHDWPVGHGAVIRTYIAEPGRSGVVLHTSGRGPSMRIIRGLGQ